MKGKKYIFVRYRHCWAHGANDWQYKSFQVNSKDLEDLKKYVIDEWARELMDEFNWSDKYRGVDVEQIDCPPPEWLQSEIKNATAWVDHLQRKITHLRAIQQRQARASSQEVKVLREF